MDKIKDMKGQTHGNLLVLHFSRIRNTNAHWICKCLLCNNTAEVSRPNLLSGNTQDCGCMRSTKLSKARTRHGMVNSGAWKSWSKMKRRIKLGEKHSAIYGKIGIDPRWHVFENFLEDMGERPKGMTLDRIDNTKGYHKDNCRWATQAEQNRNRGSNVNITHNGITMCANDWAEKLGIHSDTIRRRMNRGLPVDKVLHTGSRVDSVKLRATEGH